MRSRRGRSRVLVLIHERREPKRIRHRCSHRLRRDERSAARWHPLSCPNSCSSRSCSNSTLRDDPEPIRAHCPLNGSRRGGISRRSSPSGAHDLDLEPKSPKADIEEEERTRFGENDDGC
jgi:hypothetical protein